MDKHYKVREVAEILGVGVQTVRRRLEDGSLKGTKINGYNWYIKESDLKKYIEGE